MARRATLIENATYDSQQWELALFAIVLYFAVFQRPSDTHKLPHLLPVVSTINQPPTDQPFDCGTTLTLNTRELNYYYRELLVPTTTTSQHQLQLDICCCCRCEETHR